MSFATGATRQFLSLQPHRTQPEAQAPLPNAKIEARAGYYVAK
jgi:hypothetical protein